MNGAASDTSYAVGALPRPPESWSKISGRARWADVDPVDNATASDASTIDRGSAGSTSDGTQVDETKRIHQVRITEKAVAENAAAVDATLDRGAAEGQAVAARPEGTSWCDCGFAADYHEAPSCTFGPDEKVEGCSWLGSFSDLEVPAAL